MMEWLDEMSIQELQEELRKRQSLSRQAILVAFAFQMERATEPYESISTECTESEQDPALIAYREVRRVFHAYVDDVKAALDAAVDAEDDASIITLS